MDLTHFFDRSCWIDIGDEQSRGFAIGLIVHNRGSVLILERDILSFLPYKSEIPNDVVVDNEDVVLAAKRVVKTQANVVINSVDRYVTHFDYRGLDRILKRMIVFSCSIDDSFLTIPVDVASEFRFGTYISKHEKIRYDIVKQFDNTLISFWSNTPTDESFKRFLFMQARANDIWEYSIRLLITVEPFSGFLHLRRSRRVSFPLHFELLGAKWLRPEDFDDVVTHVMEYDTGIVFEKELGYVGCYDYTNDRGTRVREFFFVVNGRLNMGDIFLEKHCEWIFLNYEESQELERTVSCQHGMLLVSKISGACVNTV